MEPGQQQPRGDPPSPPHGSAGTKYVGPGAGGNHGKALLPAVAGDTGVLSRAAQGVDCASGSASHEAMLTQLIRRQVIPRLAIAHGLPSDGADPSKVVQRASPEAIAALAEIAIFEDAVAVVAYVEALIAAGVPIEDVYLDWLTGAARQMGCDWESDRTDFSAVTIGLWKLQQAMQLLSARFLADAPAPRSPRRVMLASVPGEQHVMGIFMVSEFFRRHGWDVWSELPADLDDLLARAGNDWFDVMGLSVGSDNRLDALAEVITRLRRASRNPDALIMLGGPIIAGNPELALRLGADFTAGDARHAVARAEQAVASRLSEQFRR